MTKPLTEIELEAAKSTGTSTGNILAQFVSFAAAATIILCLLGYGVALAIEGVFGLPHSSLFSSPFELLDLSSVAILGLVDGGLNIITAGWDSILRLYSASWHLMLIGIAGWLIVVGVIFFLPKKWPNFFSRTKKTKKAPLSFTERTVLANAVVICAIVFQPILALLGLVVVLTVTALIGMAPLMGYSSGEAYIKKWVITPELCTPTVSLSARKGTSSQQKESSQKKRAAMCIRISDKGQQIAIGRLVFSTSSSVVLFNPNTASATRIPISEAIIESVSEIPPLEPSVLATEAKRLDEKS